MKHNKAAREIAESLFEDGIWQHKQKAIAAKLKDLYGEVPEDLEATVKDAINSVFEGEDVFVGDDPCCMVQPSELLSNITTAVAQLCQKPEVPESLEAAVREAESAFHSYRVGDFIQCVMKYVEPLVTNHERVIADKDKMLEIQHKTIYRLNEEVKELQQIIDALNKHIAESRESPDEP